MDAQKQVPYRCLPIGRTIADMTRRIKEAGNERKIASAQIYLADRVWDSDEPRLAWVIFNGSEADQHRTDPTIRRCIGFARAWGYGGVDIANLYGLVSKNPAALRHAGRSRRRFSCNRLARFHRRVQDVTI